MSDNLTARDALMRQLTDYLMTAILDGAAHWEVDFADALPGEVVSVSDAANVAARAVLASGFFVPTENVLDVAQQLERDSDGRVSYLAIASWLRALTQQEPQ